MRKALIHQTPAEKLANNSASTISAIQQNTTEVIKAIKANTPDNTTLIEKLQENKQKLDEVKSASLITNQQGKKSNELLEKIAERKESAVVSLDTGDAEVITITGEKGERGEKGKDGDTPIKGKDYFDGENGKDGVDALPPPTVSEILRHVRVPKDGRDGLDALPAKDGKDGSPDDPDTVVEKVNLAKAKIDGKQVKGFPEMQRTVERYGSNPSGATAGGGKSVRYLNAGTEVSAHVTELNFSTGLTPVYDGNGRITLTAAGGGGDVVGPASATDNAIARYDGATGKLIQNSGVTVGDSNNMAITIADGANVVGLTITQNDVTNVVPGVKIITANNNGGTSGTYPAVIQGNSNSTLGPFLAYYHNSTTPAAGDFIGGEDFYANNASAVETAYAYFNAKIVDTTAGSEDGSFVIETATNGSVTTKLEVGAEDGTSLNGISIGATTASGVLSSRGNQDLILQTGNATTGNITIADGAAGQITLAPATTGVTQILSTDAGVNGPVLELYHDSATPAAADIVGNLVFSGRDSVANKQEYGRIRMQLSDPTSTSEDGVYEFLTATAGASIVSAYLSGSSGLSPGANDLIPLGTGLLNWSDLFLASGAVINFNNGNVTITHSAGILTVNGGVAVTSFYTASTLELGHATDTTLSRSAAGVLAVEGVVIPSISSINTLTNKRVTSRVLSAASYTTDTGTSLNGDNLDLFSVTAQAGALLFNAPGGTPTDGQKLIITVASSAAVARALTWNAIFEASTVALPTTTAATTAQLNIGFMYSSARVKWVCLAVA